MTNLKSVFATTALVLCFAASPALAANSNPPNPPTPPAAAAPVVPAAPAAKNDQNPSASVVAECAVKADAKGLKGDEKGAFLTECEGAKK